MSPSSRDDDLLHSSQLRHSNKAVADGALSFHLDRAVSERISKYNYGIRSFTAYDASIPGHVERKDKVFMSGAGVLSLTGQYSVILPKVSRFHSTVARKRNSCRASLLPRPRNSGVPISARNKNCLTSLRFLKISCVTAG